ncbi:MAG: RNB domain-containing ribonuclease, partial [Desulfovibrio sp.]|nr:RNB domain-containing ribonuclease [Desulfovibrio sp.]
FPKNIRFPNPEPEKRLDLTDLPFVTIDGATAKDFDDAIYVQQEESGWRLDVAIADVSHYVKADKKKNPTSLDQMAFERGNSFYGPTSVAPMLPFFLSQELCSLTPQQNRAVVLCRLKFDKLGTRLSAAFALATICSHARLTYDTIKDIFLDQNPSAQKKLLTSPHGQAIYAQLTAGLNLTALLHANRLQAGSLTFPSSDLEYTLSKKGILTNLTYKENHAGHQLIEECMLQANQACAQFLSNKQIPFLYRNHISPSTEELNHIFELLKTCAPECLPSKSQLTASDLSQILQRAKEQKKEEVVARLCLRILPKATYASQNRGHFALATDAYCHFTSPIRRYADLLTHRALRQALGVESSPIPANKRLEHVAYHLNSQERLAQSMEQQIKKIAGCLLLKNKAEKYYASRVIGVQPYGVFVALEHLPIEAFVAVQSLSTERLHYNAAYECFQNSAGKKILGLGGQLCVKITHIDLHSFRINCVPKTKLISSITPP